MCERFDMWIDTEEEDRQAAAAKARAAANRAARDAQADIAAYNEQRAARLTALVAEMLTTGKWYVGVVAEDGTWREVLIEPAPEPAPVPEPVPEPAPEPVPVRARELVAA